MDQLEGRDVQAAAGGAEEEAVECEDVWGRLGFRVDVYVISTAIRWISGVAVVTLRVSKW